MFINSRASKISIFIIFFTLIKFMFRIELNILRIKITHKFLWDDFYNQFYEKIFNPT